LSDPDQILISASVYEEVRKTDDVICRYIDVAKVKGKEEAIEVYRVIWGDEDIVAGVTRAGTGALADTISKKQRLMRKRLEMDITRENNNLKVTTFERSGKESSTLQPYEEMHVTMPKIEERCQEVIGLLNRANTRGQVSKDIFAKLRDVGLVLFDNLLTTRAKEIIRGTQVQDLVFNIDDSLVQIPWELLYDGTQFLCQKFNIGRIVKTKHNIANIKTRRLSRPLKMLIITDPRGDLKGAFEEGRQIREETDKSPSITNANQRSGQISVDYIIEKLRNFDIVHYAGHADYDSTDPSQSGWLLEDGKFTSTAIMKLVGGRPMPSLVFCNACQSGLTQEWKLGPSYGHEIYGLANAFLLSGVQHYVGTFWEVLDEPSAKFALEFYRRMMSGVPIGEAMRMARLLLIKEYGEDTIVWASYMLYGDPASNYFDFTEVEEEQDQKLPYDGLQDAVQVRSTPRETVRFNEQEVIKARRKRATFGGLSLILLIVFLSFFLQRQIRKTSPDDPYLTGYSFLSANQTSIASERFQDLPKEDARRYEGLAAVFMKLGDSEKALDLSKKALEIAPQNTYAHVIIGNLSFMQGKLSDAEKEYEMAARQTKTVDWQKAEALNGLGRIFSSKGDLDKAIQCYGEAAALNPDSATIHTNHGMTMQKLGNFSEAITAYRKAASLDPNDPFAASIIADAEQKEKLAADKDRRERIDKLIVELVENSKNKPTIPLDEQESWTSTPLTISFLDFQQKGMPSMREGEDEFLLLKINSLLQENGRIKVVEREMLDKLLEELRLSSSELVNPQMALKVGRILAARIIATGAMMRYNNKTQINFRLTDTETTALKGAVLVTSEDLNKLAEDSAHQIIEKITSAYPIRGKIAVLEGKQVVVNIGANNGLSKGMEFTVLEDQALAQEKHTIVRHRKVGMIQITSMEKNIAYASILEQSQGFKEGMKIEELRR
jgi:CHAT domain-containing protein/Flp pilus assembly protein TadD